MVAAISTAGQHVPMAKSGQTEVDPLSRMETEPTWHTSPLEPGDSTLLTNDRQVSIAQPL